MWTRHLSAHSRIEWSWYVESVELKLPDGEIHVHLTHEKLASWPCPECGVDSKLHDHQPERHWRHLDTCQTILHAEPPSSESSEHGVRVVKLPWAEPLGRFTALLEALASEWLKAASQTAVAVQLRLSWDEIHGILERAVKRGVGAAEGGAGKPPGSRRKSVSKGHKYLTLVNDLKRTRVLYVAEPQMQRS